MATTMYPHKHSISGPPRLFCIQQHETHSGELSSAESLWVGINKPLLEREIKEVLNI